DIPCHFINGKCELDKDKVSQDSEKKVCLSLGGMASSEGSASIARDKGKKGKGGDAKKDKGKKSDRKGVDKAGSLSEDGQTHIPSRYSARIHVDVGERTRAFCNLVVFSPLQGETKEEGKEEGKEEEEEASKKKDENYLFKVACYNQEGTNCITRGVYLNGSPFVSVPIALPESIFSTRTTNGTAVHSHEYFLSFSCSSPAGCSVLSTTHHLFTESTLLECSSSRRLESLSQACVCSYSPSRLNISDAGQVKDIHEKVKRILVGIHVFSDSPSSPSDSSELDQGLTKDEPDDLSESPLCIVSSIVSDKNVSDQKGIVALHGSTTGVQDLHSLDVPIILGEDSMYFLVEDVKESIGGSLHLALFPTFSSPSVTRDIHVEGLGVLEEGITNLPLSLTSNGVMDPFISRTELSIPQAYVDHLREGIEEDKFPSLFLFLNVSHTDGSVCESGTLSVHSLPPLSHPDIYLDHRMHDTLDHCDIGDRREEEGEGPEQPERLSAELEARKLHVKSKLLYSGIGSQPLIVNLKDIISIWAGQEKKEGINKGNEKGKGGSSQASVDDRMYKLLITLYSDFISSLKTTTVKTDDTDAVDPKQFVQVHFAFLSSLGDVGQVSCDELETPNACLDTTLEQSTTMFLEQWGGPKEPDSVDPEQKYCDEVCVEMCQIDVHPLQIFGDKLKHGETRNTDEEEEGEEEEVGQKSGEMEEEEEIIVSTGKMPEIGDREQKLFLQTAFEIMQVK
ncbi:hypothetical protein ADUPG1_013235, partial [Aduncisulcus paluster]